MAQQKVLSTRDITKKDVVDPKRKLEAQMWIQTVLGISFNDDFFDELHDGTIICELLNKIVPGTCTKYKKSKIAFVARNNISIFIRGAKKLGIPQTDIFETRDLFDKQRLSAVVQTIYAVSAKSRKLGFSGPFIGVAYADANKRHFTKEQLAKSKSAIPMLSRGDKKTNVSSTHDTYGIIKDKNVSNQKISNVPSVWSQGAKKINVSSDHDSYGIIKTKQNKHSNVPSIWEQGGKKIDRSSSKQDSYGIIKTHDQATPSNVQSVWQQGARKVNNSSDHDSYGIIKTKQTKHSNVPSVWEKGGRKIDNSSKQDSYGIIKTHDNTPSNVQSVWQQGSKKTDVSSDYDAYGIVKSKNATKHSNVQSVWEKGSKQIDSGKKQDSYGIVKVND